MFAKPLQQLAIVSITGYQRFLSPYKGFSCAHRVLYGGESCSQYTKKMIAQFGLKAGLHKARLRFKACSSAHSILQGQLPFADHHHRKKCKDRLECLECCFPDVECEGCIPEIDCGVLECEGCVPEIDCGFLECGGCDFGVFNPFISQKSREGKRFK